MLENSFTWQLLVGLQRSQRARTIVWFLLGPVIGLIAGASLGTALFSTLYLYFIASLLAFAFVYLGWFTVGRLTTDANERASLSAKERVQLAFNHWARLFRKR